MSDLKKAPKNWTPLDSTEIKRLGAVYSHEENSWMIPDDMLHLANKVSDSKGFGWCNKCRSYCYGDCEV